MFSLLNINSLYHNNQLYYCFINQQIFFEVEVHREMFDCVPWKNCVPWKIIE